MSEIKNMISSLLYLPVYANRNNLTFTVQVAITKEQLEEYRIEVYEEEIKNKDLTFS